MESFEKLNDVKELTEIEEFVDKYIMLQDQMKNPTRSGMIKALSGALKVAYNEIIALERSQGNIYPKPWTSFSNHDLLCKLPKYIQGLNNHAVNKFGEETFKYLLEEHKKRTKTNSNVVTTCSLSR